MRRPARIVHAYGQRVEVPAAEEWVELVSYTVPAGRLLIADLYQGIMSDLATSIGTFCIDGLTWDAFEAEGSGRNPKRLVLNPAGPIPWTKLDGQPVVSGHLVPAGRRLLWGATIDPVAVEGAFGSVMGAIRGLEVDSDIEEETLLELLSRR